MKKSVRILGMFVLVAIYYIAVDFSIPSPNIVDVQQKHNPSEKHFSTASSALFFHDSQSVSSVTNITSLTHSNSKNPFQEFWPTVTVAQHIFDTKFTQYTRSLRNSLILRRKADIIFPSHYFW